MLLRALLSSLLALLGGSVLVASCAADPVGVDDCRKIEQARCEAGRACGLVDDVEACKRFYRDQCLHGLPLDDRPGDPVINACVASIQRLGQCARTDPEAALSACPEGAPAQALPGQMLSSVCEAVRFPERTQECGFLAETASDAGTDSSSNGSDSASSGGGGGAGGGGAGGGG